MATLKKLAIGSGAALLAAWLLFPNVSAFQTTVNCGGSFTPSFNCLIPGLWDFNVPSTVTGRTYDVPFKTNGVEATGVVSKTVDLTNAQVLLLGSTPVTIVAAPGIGKSIDVVRVTLIFNRTGAYSGVQNVKLYYGSRTAGNAASAQITGSGFFDASASIAIVAAGTPDNTNPSVSNQAVVIQQTVLTAMGGGNASNSVRVVVNYRIVATGLGT